ncbi:MAG: 2-octaprenyl-6-methoxyphenyl hydroxylase [Gammaproteobacteria bacterium]|nr:2-octaprenyl-6-methoxyphenyl hydroxylase [Gammaproteobacteria bacterium]
MRVSSLREHYDVVVVGGGLVGASFACALSAKTSAKASANPLHILVTEPVAALQASTSFDSRSTALSYGSRCIYERLGLWQELGPLATPIKNIHVSDRGHFGAVRIDHANMGVEALGYVAENQHLGVVLTAALDRAPNIDFLCPAVIDELQPRPDGMRVRVQHGEGTASENTTTEITAGLVVLADGGKSILSERLGISGSVTHYGQKAIIANIAFEKSHDNVAFERFTDRGPLAVLPLATHQGDNRGALIWTVEEHEADEILALPEPLFLQQLQERFGYRLGHIEKVGARVAYPLSLAVAREQIRPGLVLLGNVAHTLHPVAGQGLNLALRDSEVLAELLAAAHDEGLSPGAMTVLQRYIDAQCHDQDATIDFSHYMMRLFSNGNPALIWARKFGLFSIDLIPVMKKTFARQAMGLAERRTRRA